MTVIENNEFHDLLELPWRKIITFLRPNFKPKRLSSLVDANDAVTKPNSRFVSSNFKHISDLTFVDPFRLTILVDLIEQIKDIDGDIVECGSCKGGSGIMMALALEFFNVKKHIHLFDSFQGLSKPDIVKDKGYSQGMFKSNLDDLNKRVKQMGLQDMITIHDGWFKDTFPVFLKEYNKKIALLNIDCDLYTSTNECFQFLYPLVSYGGCVSLDEFNDGGRGEKISVLENTAHEKQTIFISPASQAYFFKEEKKASLSKYVYNDAGFDYSFDRLFNNRNYMVWLDSKMNTSYQNMVLEFIKDR